LFDEERTTKNEQRLLLSPSHDGGGLPARNLPLPHSPIRSISTILFNLSMLSILSILSALALCALYVS